MSTNRQPSFSTNDVPPPLHETATQADHAYEGEQDDGLSKVVATVAVVAVGAAVFEASGSPAGHRPWRRCGRGAEVPSAARWRIESAV
jgi:hypothetical protein